LQMKGKNILKAELERDQGKNSKGIKGTTANGLDTHDQRL